MSYPQKPVGQPVGALAADQDASAVTFRAIWPIVNESAPFVSLIREAEADLPVIVARSHARLRGFGRWSVANSCEVPGSGRVTQYVLMYEAPAMRAPVRGYRRRAA